jgi:hypothetical protein
MLARQMKQANSTETLVVTQWPHKRQQPLRKLRAAANARRVSREPRSRHRTPADSGMHRERAEKWRGRNRAHHRIDDDRGPAYVRENGFHQRIGFGRALRREARATCSEIEIGDGKTLCVSVRPPCLCGEILSRKESHHRDTENSQSRREKKSRHCLCRC